MTVIQAITFAAKVKIGTKIQMPGNSILVVTETKNTAWKGDLFLNGKCVDSETFLSFDTLTNPHYNKNISIISE